MKSLYNHINYDGNADQKWNRMDITPFVKKIIFGKLLILFFQIV